MYAINFLDLIIILLLFIILTKIQAAINWQQYSLLSSSASSTAPIYSEKINQSNIAHFPKNSSSGAAKRTSFNEQVAFYLLTVSRAQQAYFFEMSKFADRFEQLGLGLSEEDENYQLVTQTYNNSAFTYAIPKENYATYKEWSGSSWIDAKEPLYSYVSGILYSKDNNNFQSILCVSKIVGELELQEPKIIEGKFICAEGTEEIP